MPNNPHRPRSSVWGICGYSRDWMAPTSMTDNAFDTPEAAEAAFYAAFDAVDLNLMASVWADGGNTLCIHPGSGLLKGKAAIMKSWMEIFSGSASPAVEYRCIEGFAVDDLAVRLTVERIRSRDDPAAAANRILATNVFLRVDGAWRLGEHHASLLVLDRGMVDGDERKLH